MIKNIVSPTALFFLLIGWCIQVPAMNKQSVPEKTTKFVSFPDFFNFDIPKPWPPYEDAVNYFLDKVTDEKPNFVLVCGDLVNGHWWDSPQCVEHMGSVYYSAWVNRLKEHGLKFYTSIGDHELGDDPWPKSKLELIPSFENVYREHLNMPENGPDNKKGLAYFVREGDLLIVTVEPFEVIGDSMHIDVMGKQLEWFKKVLKENSDSKFKIVQCHVGLWGNIKARSSSSLMLNGGKGSEFYQVMKENGIDLYLAGEFHDVTILESDGIWQIVHGSSWGREIVNTEDYLVGEVKGNEMTLQMKRIYMDAQGEYMWNLNKDKGPRKKVQINERTIKNGPEITGTLIIRKEGGQTTFINRTGFFCNP
jgi:hypothetical protein